MSSNFQLPFKALLIVLQMQTRLADLARVLGGAGVLASHSTRLTVRQAAATLQYTAGLAEQAAAAAAESGKGGRTAGLQLNRAVTNLPLVVEGAGIMLRVMAGLPGPAVQQQQQQRQGEVTEGSQADSDERTVRLVIDRSVSALDLLDLDNTNEEILKEKLFKKVKVPVESEAKQVRRESEGEPVTVVSEEPAASAVSAVPSTGRPGGQEKLSSQARERRVPAGRLSRVASFAGLGLGLGLGVLAEAGRRAAGLSRL